MGIFKKAVKKAIKGAGKLAKGSSTFTLGRAIGKAAASKVRRRPKRIRRTGRLATPIGVAMTKFFGAKVKKRTRKLPRPPIKGRKALKGRATGTASPLRRRRRRRLTNISRTRSK